VTQQRLIIEAHQIMGDQIQLTPSQQHYLRRVLRLGAGDRFVALDGQGHQWQATLTAEVAIAEIVSSEAATPIQTTAITLVAALPKGNAFDEVVRQATELGVTTIQPLISQRTLLQPSPQKLERWRRIATEATEQSERLQVPELRAPLPWNEFLTQDISGQTYICVARRSVPHLLAPLHAQPATAIALLVGPEGGWTEAEVAAAIATGWQPVTLGPGILRAVTAAIVALALVRATIDTTSDLKL
jgi:16S rRNA (uracil1498-N3)-methyltransferase